MTHFLTPDMFLNITQRIDGQLFYRGIPIHIEKTNEEFEDLLRKSMNKQLCEELPFHNQVEWEVFRMFQKEVYKPWFGSASLGRCHGSTTVISQDILGFLDGPSMIRLARQLLFLTQSFESEYNTSIRFHWNRLLMENNLYIARNCIQERCIHGSKIVRHPWQKEYRERCPFMKRKMIAWSHHQKRRKFIYIEMHSRNRQANLNLFFRDGPMWTAVVDYLTTIPSRIYKTQDPFKRLVYAYNELEVVGCLYLRDFVSEHVFKQTKVKLWSIFMETLNVILEHRKQRKRGYSDRKQSKETC